MATIYYQYRQMKLRCETKVVEPYWNVGSLTT